MSTDFGTEAGPTALLMVVTMCVIGWTGCARQVQNLAPPAPVAQGNWAAVAALRPGAPIVVVTTTAIQTEGEFRALTPPTLVVTTSAGPVRILMTDVARIAVRSRGDSLANGILIGAGIGIGAALAILAAVGSQDDYILPSAKTGAPLLLGGAGAAVGALIDRAHRDEQVIYLAPPSDAPHRVPCGCP